MKKPAFTFLELLIALSLFAVAMISILQIFPVNRRFLTQSGQQTQAAFLAQEEAEYIRSLAYTNLTPGTFEAQHAVGSTTSDPLNNFQRQTVVTLIDGSWNTTSTDVGLKRIDITVTWTENRSINRSYLLTTYAYNH